MQQAAAAASEMLAGAPVAREHLGDGRNLRTLATALMTAGRLEEAARVFAYAESYFQTKGFRPRRVAVRLRERLLSLLAAQRTPEALAQLFDEGHRLTDDEACALALRPVQ